MAIMIISILAIGAVSAESVDDATISVDDSELSVATVDSEISDVSAVADDAVADDAVVDDVVGDDSLGEPKTIDINDDTYSTYFDENGMLDTVSDHGACSLLLPAARECRHRRRRQNRRSHPDTDAPSVLQDLG